MLDTRRIEGRQNFTGALGLVFEPATKRRMVGDLILGQEHTEQILDLSQADAQGAGGDGKPSLLILVENDPAFGLALQFRKRLAKPLILSAEFANNVVAGLVSEPLLDLAGVLIDRLAATTGLVGLLSHGPVLT